MNKNGYTLVEVLVVAAIIAILASVSIASFSQAGKSARDGKRKADIEMIRQGLVMRRADVGSYPVQNGNVTVGSTVATALANYVSQPFPTDPLTSRSYHYEGTATGFCICANLETTDKGNATRTGLILGSGCDYGSGQPYYCVQNP